MGQALADCLGSDLEVVVVVVAVVVVVEAVATFGAAFGPCDVDSE